MKEPLRPTEWNRQSEALFLERVRPRNWQDPTPRSLYDLVVIGAGPAGLEAVDAARRMGFSIALVECDRLGGNSLNVGTVASKSLIHAGRIGAVLNHATEIWGEDREKPAQLDFALAMAKMHRARARIAGYYSVPMLAEAGVDIFFGAAHFTGPNVLRVADTELRFRKALIATGARPRLADIPGLDGIGCRTSSTIFDLTTLPRRLTVIGGGPLGCEMAQAFSRLGAHVTIIEVDPKFLPGEERDAAELLSRSMARDGVTIRLNTTITAARMEAGVKILDTVNAGMIDRVETDEVLVSVGRIANVERLGLDAAGVEIAKNGCVQINDGLQTTNPDIYAAGDVCMDLKFTNVAQATARFAVANALEGKAESCSSLLIPWCTYCNPEIAHIGMQIWDAKAQSIPVKTYTVMMQDVDRAIVDEEDLGFIKIHIEDGTDRILGATVVAERASELINEMSVIMRAGIGMTALADIIHTYPAQSEGIMLAALDFVREKSAST
ncbi:MAG: mercuric reductase [Cypionkella sp.]